MSWFAETTKIFSGLKSRFKLRETPIAQEIWMHNTIHPMTDVDRLLRRLAQDSTTGIAVAGTGLVTLDTVPQGKRRIYHVLQCNVTSGTLSISEFRSVDPTGTTIKLKVFTPALEISYFPSDMAFELDQGWMVKVNVDTLSVAGTLGYVQHYEEEEAY